MFKLSKSIGFVFAVGFALFATTSDAANPRRELRRLEREVTAAGVVFTYPIQAGINPGWVYRIERDAVSGRTYPRQVCRDLFAGTPTSDRPATLSSYTSKVRIAFNVGGDLPGAAQGLNITARAGIDRTRDVTINFSTPMIRELAEPISETGVQRTINSGCVQALSQYFNEDGTFIANPDGSPRTPIYLITRALTVDGVTYRLARNGNASLTLGATAQQIGSANVGLTAEWSNERGLVVTPGSGQRFTVGVNTKWVDNLDVLDEVSEVPRANIRGRDVTAAQAQTLAAAIGGRTTNN